MGFSEKIKLEARKRSNFRCCICRKPFVKIHHIVPLSENGDNSLENASPLCAYCHDIYGGNPEKRKQIKQMRNHWWELMEKWQHQIMNIKDLNNITLIEDTPENFKQVENKGIAIYHNIYSYEGFEESANILIDLIKNSQKESPNNKRFLYLDIQGHRNDKEGFDADMFELQSKFILGFLMPYLTEAYLPLISVKNKNYQKNDIPREVAIFPSEREAIKFTEKFKGEKSIQIFSADKGDYLE